MKRFATTICLAACLVFLCGSVAMAVNSVVVESKSVGMNATGVTAGIELTNDVGITGAVFPIELRSNSGGAYVTTAFTVAIPPANRMGASALGATFTPAANVTNKKYAVTATPECSTVPGHTYNTGVAQIDFVSPDAFLHATVSTGDPTIGDVITMDPGADASFAAASIILTFNVNGSVGDFYIDSACVRPANHLSFVDINTTLIAPAFTMGVITILPNQCPDPLSITMTPPQTGTVGTEISRTLGATDPEGDPITFCADKGTVTGTTWKYTPNCADVPSFVVTITASDKGGCPGGCANSTKQFTFTVSPADLSLGCSNVSVHWSAADASQPLVVGGGCPPYVFQASKGSVDVNGGWSYDQGCADVGSSNVTVTVTDSKGTSLSCTFRLDVTNDPATCSNPADILLQGSRTLGPAGPQADGDALTYTLVGAGTGYPGEGIVGNVYNTGVRNDAVAHTITFKESDGCSESNCTFKVVFESPYCVQIVDPDKLPPSGDIACCDTTGVRDATTLSGRNKTVCVNLQGGPAEGTGGFDFLLCYDQSGLSFLSASKGSAISHWEYFTYRTGMFGGNCGSGCPNGFVRLVAIADQNNGHALPPPGFTVSGKVACLTFFVSSDRNYINSCFHIGFCSYDCGDNVITNGGQFGGSRTFLPLSGVTFGPDYNSVACDTSHKTQVERSVHYCPGAICVIPPPDDRGDINLNGIPNEIGDAVLFTNYFIYGQGVWDATYKEAQILATDINNDGIVLTVADLIYLIRIITGDAQPFANDLPSGSPKLSPYANSVDVVSDLSNGAINIRTSSSMELGGALFVYRYSNMTVGTPTLAAASSGLEIKSRAQNGELRILVYGSTRGARVAAGQNTIVTVPVSGDGSIELAESQFSDYNGALLSVVAAKAAVPTEYALLQNYPNPFNAGTVIPVALKNASEWSLNIYNVAGQVVRTFNGSSEAGTVNVAWDGRSSDGTSVASGMYFYRVNAGDFSATKKMVLLK
ncbi:MAG: T9SS type A sorting domain-containing protein [candidate division Zixibacteria bacterium]|nr:T9SS type A sorting domain-containing protein [candidate division Zixibacteria bacterium]